MFGVVCFITILLTGYLRLLSTGNCGMRYDLEDRMDTPCHHTAGIHVVGLLCACDLSDCEQGNNDVGKIVGQQLVKTLTIKQRYPELGLGVAICYCIIVMLYLMLKPEDRRRDGMVLDERKRTESHSIT